MTYNSPPILLFFSLLGMKITRCFQTYTKVEEKDNNLEEGLATFQDALPIDEKKQFIAEEEYYSSSYSVRFYSDETYTKLKDSLETFDEEVRSQAT